MRYRIISVLFLVGFLITSCSRGNESTSEVPGTVDVGEPVAAEKAPTATFPAQDDLQLNANCTVVSQRPTPGPTQESLFPPVSEGDWIKGDQDAEVTLIEYSDFQ